MKWLVSLLLVVALGDSLAAQDSVPPKPKFKRQPNVIVVEEIDAIRTEVNTAHDIIQRLRPSFFALGAPAPSATRPAAPPRPPPR